MSASAKTARVCICMHTHSHVEGSQEGPEEQSGLGPQSSDHQVRKRRTLPQQLARRRGQLSPPPGDSFPAQQEMSNRSAVPHAPPRARCNPPHLGVSSPSSLSRASPAWDGHPSELGRRSFPHPIRVSVGHSAPEGAAVSSRPIAQSSQWRGSVWP